MTIVADRLFAPGDRVVRGSSIAVKVVADDDRAGAIMIPGTQRSIQGRIEQRVDEDGLVFLDLEPNTGAPANNYYQWITQVPGSPPVTRSIEVPDDPASTTLAGAGVMLPAATIDVASAAELDVATEDVPGLVNIGGQLVLYTGKTATSLTGCSGGEGAFAAGVTVTQGYWVGHILHDPPADLPTPHSRQAVDAHDDTAVSSPARGSLSAGSVGSQLAELDAEKATVTGLTAEVAARIADVDAEEAARIAADALLIPLAQKAVANGVATLGPDAKIPLAQIPSLAIGETFTVASQAAMLALDADRGDIAIRTDLNPDGVFWLGADDATVVANWVRIGAVDLTVDGPDATPSLRTLGTGAQQALPGDTAFEPPILPGTYVARVGEASQAVAGRVVVGTAAEANTQVTLNSAPVAPVGGGGVALDRTAAGGATLLNFLTNGVLDWSVGLDLNVGANADLVLAYDASEQADVIRVRKGGPFVAIANTAMPDTATRLKLASFGVGADAASLRNLLAFEIGDPATPITHLVKTSVPEAVGGGFAVTKAGFASFNSIDASAAIVRAVTIAGKDGLAVDRTADAVPSWLAFTQGAGTKDWRIGKIGGLHQFGIFYADDVAATPAAPGNAKLILDPVANRATVTYGLKIQFETAAVANGLEVTNLAGSTTLARIRNDGFVGAPFFGSVLATGPYLAPGASSIVATPQQVGHVPLVLGNIAAQTADRLQLRNAAGAVATRFDLAGRLVFNRPGVGAISVVDVVAFATNEVPLAVSGFDAAQAADLIQARTVPAGNPVFAVDKDGKARFGTAVAFSDATISAQLQASLAHPIVVLRRVVGQTSDFLTIQDETPATLSRIGKGGRWITKVATAPALADLADGEMAISTNASGDLVITSRIAGALKTFTGAAA